MAVPPATRHARRRRRLDAFWLMALVEFPVGKVQPSPVRRPGDGPSRRVVGLLELAHVELAHPEHRLHNAAGAGGVTTATEHLAERVRDDLPREAEPILEPTA